MDDFELEIKQGFLEEATELLGGTEQCFLTLERDPTNHEEIEKLFRLAHNLKGSAKAVGFDELGVFTHELETFLLKFKNGTFELSPAAITLLLACNDHINVIVAGLKADINAKFDNAALIAEIQAYVPDSASEAPAPAEESQSVPSPEAFAEAEAEAQAMEQQAQQPPVVAAPAVAAAAAPAAVSPQAPADAGKKGKAAAPSDEQIRVSLARVEKLINYVGEMVILQTVLRAQPQVSEHLFLRKTVHQLGKVTKEVQDLAMSLRMVPLKQTFQKMQRIVRDTSAALNKPVEIEIIGDHVEVDKTVLEQLGDPLVHLVRNAVDHGIENEVEKRTAVGKDAKGKIQLKAYHQSGYLVIEVIDDGAGLDAQRLRNKAIEKGIISESKVLTDKECHHLIFAPGFSTKAVVTEVSGRGVGMDVVRTNIEAMQGEVEIHTELGKGTTFKVILPLTLAIIDGMIVRSDEDRFVIPISHIRESLRPVAGSVKTTKELGEILLLRGETLPLFRLSTLLGRRPKEPKDVTKMIAVVSTVGDKPFSVLVDDIIGQHEVVIKQLGEEVRGVKGFAGSAILGDGVQKVNEIAATTQQNVERLLSEGKAVLERADGNAKRCDDAFGRVMKDADEVFASLTEIATASREQAQGIQEVNKAMGQLDKLTQNTTGVSHSTAASASQLNEQAGTLTAVVSDLQALVLGQKGAALVDAQAQAAQIAAEEPRAKAKPVPVSKPKSSGRAASADGKVLPMKSKLKAKSEKAIDLPGKIASGASGLPDANDPRFEEI